MTSILPKPSATISTEQQQQQQQQEQQQQQQQQQYHHHHHHHHHHHPASPSPSHHDASSASESLPSLTQGTPLPSVSTPTTDKHPKAKRKRTATKDKMILEEAYSNNPKPDKQARLDIVNRVSLNEKEVQIWFQNRRQNDRRKSRPLSQEELASLRLSGLHGISSDPVTSRSLFIEPDKTFPASDPAMSQTTVDLAPTSPQAPASPRHSQSNSEAINVTPRFISQGTNAGGQSLVTPQRPGFLSSQDTQLTHSFSSSVGYLANRWNLGSSFSTPFSRRSDDSFKFDAFPPSSCSSISSYRANQSHVRLSLSLEGKAELVPNDASPTRDTPSRPAPKLPALSQPRQRTLQRSQSAFPAVTLPPISDLTSSLPPRLLRGRSRDVHAWELCADADTRDELTTQAENESNGSAIAAISLLRSTGGILQPSGTKRNAPLSKLSRSRELKKPKLSRTSSSFARLENIMGSSEQPQDSPCGKMNVSMLVSPADSDKENWSPDEDGNAREGHRRLVPVSPLKLQNARRLGRALEDQKSLSSFLNSRSNPSPSELRGLAKGIEIFRDPESKTETSRPDEVGKLMRGSDVGPIKKGDMDCVAGLLSLSQGAWR